MAFHTPHGSARFRLPWSWSSFDYRTLCEELWAQCGDARFEVAKVATAPDAARRRCRRPTAAILHRRALIVDALGWRRVLGPGENVQPPDALISRGLEVHPDGGGSDLDVWIDRSLIRKGYAWSVPAAASSASASAPTSRATTSRSRRGTSPGGSAWTPCATRATGSPTRSGPRPRTACSSSGDSAGHCFPLSGEGIRTAFYFGIACGRELRRVLAGESDARRRRWPPTARSPRATRPRSGSPCGSSG